MNALRLLLKVAIPILILLIGYSSYKGLAQKVEAPQKRIPPPFTQVVEVIPLVPTNYTVMVRARGVVRPRTDSTLIPEVSGRVHTLSPKMREGAFFTKGELLLEIEPDDYRTAIVLAEAEEARAQMKIEQEKARAAQALRDWKKLGGTEPPSTLALREPQLAEASADRKAAGARLEQARRNLDRTRIYAPYDGRVLEKRVDVGQYVSTGSVLASIYAVDVAEIRLPVSADERAMIDIPERYRDRPGTPEGNQPAVIFTSSSNPDHSWTGRIVRSQGAIDTASRQHVLIGQVENPYGDQGGRPPLLAGQFVGAEIHGRRLTGVLVIPRAALRENREVLIVDPERRLRRKAVEVLWGEPDRVALRNTLPPRARLCVTPLAYAAEGGRVQVRGEAADRPGGEKETRPGPGAPR